MADINEPLLVIISALFSIIVLSALIYCIKHFFRKEFWSTKMSKITDRMGWYVIPWRTRLWVTSFLLLVGIGTVLGIVVPETYNINLLQWLALVLVCILLGRLITGPSKKLNKEED